MNKNCGIYKIISPTGRIYIGQSVNIEKRWKNYKHCKGQPKLENSFKKYGVENHQFDIIEYCLEEELDCSERFWQDEFDVLNGGLNCTLTNCGDKRYIHSKETKRKISEAQLGEKNHMYGKIVSQDTKDKISKTLIGVLAGEKNPRYGKVGTLKGVQMSKETKNKISKFMLKRFETEEGYWKGKKLSEEHVEKSVNSKKEKYNKIDNPNFGKKRSDSTKNKISKTRLDKNIGKNGEHPLVKLVLCLETGIFYSCAKEAAIAHNINIPYFRSMLNPNTKDKNKTSLIYC